MSTVLELIGAALVGAGFYLASPWLALVWGGAVLIACGYAVSNRSS